MPKLVSEEEAVVQEVLAPDEDEILRRAGVYSVWGEVAAGTLRPIVAEILLRTIRHESLSEEPPLLLVVCSPGGDGDEAAALIDAIETAPFDVATLGLGHCASAAAMILAAGTKGKRSIGPSTQVMIHPYSWGTVGKHQELVAARRAEDITYDTHVKFWMRHSRYRTRREVEKHLMRHEDHFMTAREALSHGIVDRVADLRRLKR